jgi:hypothetical protein
MTGGKSGWSAGLDYIFGKDWHSMLCHYKGIGNTGAASCATTKRTGWDKANGLGDTDYADC